MNATTTYTAPTYTAGSAVAAQFLLEGNVVERGGSLFVVASPEREVDNLARTVSWWAQDVETGAYRTITFPLNLMVTLYQEG